MTGPTVRYLIRIELRRRGRSLAVLGLLVAMLVGTVLASLAGARRSASSFDRYLDRYQSLDAMVFGAEGDRAGLVDLAAVDRAIDFELVAAVPALDSDAFFPLFIAEGGAIPFELMRAPVVDGRFPVPASPLEVALSERTARRLDMHVGDRLPLDVYTQDGWDAFNAGEDIEPDGPGLELHVVGIVRDPGDIGARESDVTFTFLSPAFRDTYPVSEVGRLSDGTLVSVADGHTLTDVSDAMQGHDVEIDASFSSASARRQVTPTTNAIATALRLFATVAALAGLLAIGQAVARLHAAAGADDVTLSALGMGRAERWARLAVPSAAAMTAGTVVGLALAVATSPLFPVGLARRAEPDPGITFDALSLVLGGVASLVLLTGLVATSARRRLRDGVAELPPGRASRWSRAAADLGAPTPAVTGLSLVSGTSGRQGRIAVAGTLLSVLGVVAALVFSASVDRLRGEPRLYGWGWDAAIEGADLTDLGESPTIAPIVDDDPEVLAAATLYGQIQVILDGTPAFATAVAEGDPALRSVIVRGASPKGETEVALGGDTLEEIDADVGDTITVSLGGRSHRMVVSGVVALPVSADGGSSAAGAYLSPESVRAFDLATACVDSDSCTRTIAVALQPGSDPKAFAARYEDADADIHVAFPTPPGEVDRLTAVEDLPRYLAVFLAALAAAAVSFATATTVRQRRRDLAMMRVLGMTGRQVRTVVMVLVFAVTASGAAIGAGLGLVVGRQVWRAVTQSLSLPFSPTLPLAATVLVPVAAMVLAQLVATASRRLAGRIPAGLVLRAE